MNRSRVCLGLISFHLILATVRLAAQPSPPAPAPSESGGPLIQFDQKEYNWGEVESGVLVNHVFIVTNTGNQTLVISNVHPSCGCTTAADWTKQIAPGQTGTIPIQFNSTHYSGPRPITKTIDIASNAKDHPRETLFLRGLVRKTIEVIPPAPVISIVADQTNSASTIVRLTCQTEQSVSITDPVSSNPSITADLQTVTPGKEYKLIVTASPPFAVGSVTAAISLKTSLTNTPVFTFNVVRTVQPEIQVSPPQLRVGTLPNVWTTNHSVFIRGNGASLLSLSDPESSDPKLVVQVSPIGVAGMYNLLIAFPPNYRIEPGQHVEISVKSNNPHEPVIKVPLVQYPRGPGAAAALSGLPRSPGSPPAPGHP